MSQGRLAHESDAHHEQKTLQRAARALFAKECPPSLVRELQAPDSGGMPAELWKGLADMGIFGMAMFVAERRVREIGIRKILGASVFNLWRMLSVDFVVLICISLVIASPAGWYLMHNWLARYAYHTELSWWIFAITGIGTILITLLTVSYQTVKAARNNPGHFSLPGDLHRNKFGVL